MTAPWDDDPVFADLEEIERHLRSMVVYDDGRPATLADPTSPWRTADRLQVLTDIVGHVATIAQQLGEQALLATALEPDAPVALGAPALTHERMVLVAGLLRQGGATSDVAVTLLGQMLRRHKPPTT